MSISSGLDRKSNPFRASSVSMSSPPSLEGDTGEGEAEEEEEEEDGFFLTICQREGRGEESGEAHNHTIYCD